MAEQELKHFVRVANTDLLGKKPIMYALAKIDGIGYNTANALCKIIKLDSKKKTGLLTEEEVKKLDEAIKSQKMPSWLFNRKKDSVTGKEIHLITAQLKLTRENDVKMMKKMKTYKGMRHSLGQPVRGQRTRSHFRKGSAVGVQKTKVVKVAKDKK